MKQKFITAKGRVEVERDILFVKTVKFYFFESTFALVLFAVLPLLILPLMIAAYDEPKDFIRILLWGILTINSLPEVYRIAFKKSFATRIPINHVLSFEVRPDMNGLETHVVLRLHSGRERKLTFRTLEKQHEMFTEFLSQHIAQPQLA
jgi:hypothetical protein